MGSTYHIVIFNVPKFRNLLIFRIRNSHTKPAIIETGNAFYRGRDRSFNQTPCICFSCITSVQRYKK